MAHFARLDANNIVTEVIVVNNETATTEQVGIDFCRGLFQTEDRFVQASYNTIRGQHLLGGTPLRKNYPSVGFKYDESRDAFIRSQPYDSWVLDEDTCDWVAPVTKPTDGDYEWNESTQTWDNVTATDAPG